jgi:2,4-dienoyl-CoA reductase (NADPH2)
VVEGRHKAGRRVAIIGAGGIGFDIAELLTAGEPADGHLSDGRDNDPAIAAFRDEWGIDPGYAARGGLKPAHEPVPPRQVWMLQRKESKVGAGLAKTTGWIRRTLLKRRGVVMVAGVEYDRIDDAGLHFRVDDEPQSLDVDTVVVCAGQEPRRDLVADLEAAGIRPRLIGGADVAVELDAKRAIDQGTRVALAL